MNILYIHTHDSGRCFSPYGYAVPTPNIERLADEGVTFRQAFCANPTCSPSRVAMLTGQYAHSAGMLGLSHRGFAMSDHHHHLTHVLAANGYETVLSGVQHEAEIDKLAYQRILRNEAYQQEPGYTFTVSDYASARQAADYLKNEAPSDKPFFLSVGFVNTHRKFPPPAEDIRPGRLRPPEGMPDTAANREDMAGLATALRVVDNCVGIVLDALESSAHRDNTLVLFTTDHGIAYPRYKCTLYDGGIGVAMIWRIPRLPHPGRTIDALVSQVDVFPTLCELTGIAPPDWLQGTSLCPLLYEKQDSVRDEVFAEVNFHAAYEPIRCIRTQRYKYIRYGDATRHTPVPSNIDDGIAKEFVVRHGFLEKEVPREQLYDLALDPGEWVNLAQEPDMASVLEELRTRLQTWQAATADPLLDTETLALPSGAAANKMTAYSAKEKDLVRG